MRSNYRPQSTKATATLYEILNPEGFRVHTCKSQSDAYRIAERFSTVDCVRHTVRPVTRYNVRDGL